LISKDGGKGGSLAGTIGLESLVNYVVHRPAAVPSLTADPVFTSCQAELEAEKRLAAVEAASAGNGGGHHNGGRSGKEDGADVTAAELVRDNVNMQMTTATSPESQLSYSVPSRADQGQVQQSIQTFELRAGASDVTSYHDFSTLQIAFQSVWTEIFHGKLAGLGQELYHECVKLKEFAGLDGQPDRPIDTIDDLRALMDEVRNLSSITQDNIPWQPRGGAPADGTSVSSTSAGDFAKAVLDPASAITGLIGDKTVAAVVDPAGAAIDVVSTLLRDKQPITWDSFTMSLPGLPQGYDRITPIFEDDAVADGEVEIVLVDSRNASSPWKGIDFLDYDGAGNLQGTWRISNSAQDPGVWDHSSYNRLPLYTPQVQSGLLVFGTESYFGIHHGFFVLGGLAERIKNRTRVTFTW
jgi:hypothetical protein